ncbi:MAG: zinc ribbon domain-containing protein [Christensenellales bacterium]
MIYCRECGNEMDDNSRFCSDCAAPLDRDIDAGYRVRRMEEKMSGFAAGKPRGIKAEYNMKETAEESGVYDEEPLTVKVDLPQEPAAPKTVGLKNTVVVRSRRALRGRSAVVTTGGFVGIFMLMFIPLVNLAALIVWALGGCNKVVKQNFARAALLVALIGLVLAGVNYIYGDVISVAAKGLMQEIEAGSVFSGISGMFSFLEKMLSGFKKVR